jgi:transcriptional regulator with XRE-family HTH domain
MSAGARGALFRRFRANVAELLKQNEWSLSELSKRSGRAKSNLSDILRGEGNPTLDLVEDVALALGVDGLDLLGREQGGEVDLLELYQPELLEGLRPALRELAELEAREGKPIPAEHLGELNSMFRRDRDPGDLSAEEYREFYEKYYRKLRHS